MFVVMFVFVVVNAVLLYFAYRYRGKEGVKATFYPHNNKLELIWTVVPAVVLSALIFYSVGVWHEMMGDAPKDALHVELYGKQFDWTIRYAGADKKFGESNFTLIDDGIGNTVGMDLEDTKSHDDFYIMDTIVLPVNKPVKFRIVARDVLHSATMMHFRMKMDAVPGMPTSFWFTPKYTTAEMRKIKKNPEFVYEMSCQQICGGGHWNMRRIVKIVEQAEYDTWFAKQKSFYATLQEQNAPAPADTTKALAPVEEANKKSVAQAAKAAGKLAMK
jgi:cytochrome c oxidase subunit 2